MKMNTIKLLFLGLIGILLTGKIIAADIYQYPVGVPDPLTTWKPSGYSGPVVHPIWGDAPASWSEANQSGVPAYYIDMNHPQATDSNNTYGTPEKPRYSIPEITYAAGSYVEIHGGPYTGGGQIIFTANGTVDKPVWIRGLPGELPDIIGETIAKGQYVILENLKYSLAAKTIQFRPHNSSNLHHAVVRNCVFEGDGVAVTNNSAIALRGGSASNRFHDFIVYNNQISYFGNSYSDVDPAEGIAPENDFHGINPHTNVDRVWVLRNVIHHMGGDSIQVGTASTADENRTSHVYIGDNDFYDNLENGIDVKGSAYFEKT